MHNEINGREPSAHELAHAALVNYGHFTSMQVRGGGVRGLDLHLARLDAANRELFGESLDGELVRAWMRHAARAGTDATMRVTGFAIFVVSFALLTWARATLGNSFSVTPQAKALVTAGIYSRVRYPVYLFGALMLSGLFLYINMPWLLVILTVIVPLQIVRARTEEKVLVGKFGDQYLDYRKQTWL